MKSLLVLITAVHMVFSALPIVIEDSLQTYYGSTTFLALDNGTLLFVDSDERIRSVRIDDPSEVQCFELEWNPETPRWGDGTNTLLHAVSPDGTLICFSQQVRFPDSLQTFESRIPGPVAVVVCGTDGSDARTVALSFDIGGGPHFDFTIDSRHIYGFDLACNPTPGDFAAYVLREDDSDVPTGHLIDVETGRRSGEEDLVAGDGYSNPWSDLIATGHDSPSMIVNVVTQEVLYESSHEEDRCLISKWVLPNAGLADIDGCQVLLYSDGRMVENPGEHIAVYAVLTDGRCIFSYDDTGVPTTGNIDWETFEASDTVSLTGLEGYDISRNDILTDGEMEWLIFVYRNALYAYELPSD